jgi:hypothetical protein
LQGPPQQRKIVIDHYGFKKELKHSRDTSIEDAIPLKSDGGVPEKGFAHATSLISRYGAAVRRSSRAETGAVESYVLRVSSRKER